MNFFQVDFGSPAFDEVLHLRNRILRQPLQLVFTTKQITAESTDFHFACYDECFNILGTLLMKKINSDTLKMKQVAVGDEMQDLGIGSYMVRAVEQWAKHMEYTNIELAARDVAVDFYKKLEYTAIGDPFIEVGITHQKMIKRL